MVELTDEQRRLLTQPEPTVRDPETNQTYVLVRSDLYARVRGLLDDDWAKDTFRATMEVFARDGWDDPRMDVYDELDPRKTP
ncbi:MAG: hypothetical protein ACRC33_28305 [Gemmataceae bacterium]